MSVELVANRHGELDTTLSREELESVVRTCRELVEPLDVDPTIETLRTPPETVQLAQKEVDVEELTMRVGPTSIGYSGSVEVGSLHVSVNPTHSWSYDRDERVIRWHYTAFVNGRKINSRMMRARAIQPENMAEDTNYDTASVEQWVVPGEEISQLEFLMTVYPTVFPAMVEDAVSESPVAIKLDDDLQEEPLIVTDHIHEFSQQVHSKEGDD